MSKPVKFHLPDVRHMERPRGMTGAERISKYRRARGGRQVNFTATPEVAAGIIYLQKQWGMESTQETVMAAVRFLVLMTRCGLQHLPQSIDD